MSQQEVAVDLANVDRRRGWRGGKVLSDGHTIYWWVELLIVLAVDVVYESIRNFSTRGPVHAYENALRVIDWQAVLHLNHEKAIQDWALHWQPIVVFSNYYYGSAYIALTIVALIFLYRKFPDDYPLWRNTLAVGTLLGLVGFATFPLMPPRLLDVHLGHDVYGYVDTLVKYPTFWSFDSSAMKSISNQYAAMPSLHCGWAFWGFFVFWPRVRHWWTKVLVVLYPVTTVFVVVATANHYFLDAVGGAAIFLIGYVVARVFTKTGAQRLAAVPSSGQGNELVGEDASTIA